MPSDSPLIDRAVALARELQQRALELQTPHERRQQAELDRMLQTPSDKVTMMQMTDQAFRSRGAARTVDQFTQTVKDDIATWSAIIKTANIKPD